MSRILMIGTGPLFSPDVKIFNGQALRTWHLTRPLRDSGHAIDLVVLPVEAPGPIDTSGEGPEDTDAPFVFRRRDTFKYRLVTTRSRDLVIRNVQELHDQGTYDCIVAVNVNAASIVCRLATQLPIWIDLNGYMMGEAQTKAKTDGADTYLKHFWSIERLALRRGDRFSGVSYKQMYATLGELATLGRLNLHTFSHPFLSVIPNAAYEEFLDPASYPPDRHYRGKVFPADAFAVLWSGGFNTWADTRTLVAALSLAMELEPRIHLVTTGGAIPGHDEQTYLSFQEELRISGFEDRCHLLDWVEARELFPLYKECDLGINVDSLNYETMFGARNRLTNMMAAGLPILTTLGTEISEIIDENRLGYVVPIGAVQELADTLVRASRDPQECRDFASRAKRHCTEHFSYKATTRILQRWAAHPLRAPDNEEKVRRWPDERHLASVALNSLEEEVIRAERYNTEDLLRDREELESMRRKPLYRIYKSIFS